MNYARFESFGLFPDLEFMIATEPHSISSAVVLNDAAVGSVAGPGDGVAVAEEAAAAEHVIRWVGDEWDGAGAEAGMIAGGQHFVFAARDGAVAPDGLRGGIVLARPHVIVAGVTAADDLCVVSDHSGFL